MKTVHQTRGRKLWSRATVKALVLSAICVVIALVAMSLAQAPGSTPPTKVTPAVQSPVVVQPVAVSNTVPDVNDITTPDAQQQVIGSTETLIDNPNEQLRRTKKADGTFEFGDLSVASKGTLSDGTVVTSGPTTTVPIHQMVATSTTPDVTDTNTPEATSQKVGSTVELVHSKYRQLLRKKDADGTFEFTDITAVAKYTPVNGQSVTSGLVPGSTAGSVVTVGAVTSSGDNISLMSASSGGTPYASGCMDATWTYFRYNKLLFGKKDPLYHMNVGAHWCAIGDHIGRTSDGKSALVPKMLWFTGLAPYLQPVVGSLTWAGGDYWDGMVGRAPDSSWRIRGSQSVQQCFPVYGCSGFEMPWLWVDLHGNLTWLFDAGH